MATPQSPASRSAYEARATSWEAAARGGRRREEWLGWGRVGVFVTLLAVASLAVDTTVSPWWSLPALAAFVLLGAVHERVRGTRLAAERRRAYAHRGLARLDGTWRAAGATGERWMPAGHLFALDLDLVGPGSVFQLVNTATTDMGEAALVRSLLSPSTAEAVAARQVAVRELAADYDLREDLAAAGGTVTWSIHHERLSQWAEEATDGPISTWRLGAVILALANAAAIWGYAVDALPGIAPVVSVGMMGLAAILLRRRVRRAVAGVDRAVRDLEALGRLLDVLERRRFEAPHLAGLREALEVGGVAPSTAIRRLTRWADLAASTRNQLTIPLRLMTLWLTHVGLAVDAWRRRHGRSVATWLSVVGEIEGLCSLAAHAFDHPEDAMPDLTGGGPALFVASTMAHPLLPAATAVANDVELGQPTRLLIVSGSNMSGKSTLLRAIGVNAALAMAGGTVRAQRLRLTPLRLGASIVVSDSLADGRSRFYAEILRLKAVMAVAETAPTLVLIDEILQGTNSHDRRIGTEAIARGFLARGALGVMTTHDLALTGIADGLGPVARNVHFADEVTDGRLTFDYRLRPGVVTRSNALRLMRQVGLPVPDAEG